MMRKRQEEKIKSEDYQGGRDWTDQWSSNTTFDLIVSIISQTRRTITIKNNILLKKFI